MIDTPLVLGKRIAQSYPNSFCSYLILGRRGIGKSSYSIKAVKQAYERLGYSESQSWAKALSCLKFSIKDTVSFLENITPGEPEVALILDDARVHMSGLEYFRNKNLVSHLLSLFDTIRTLTSSLILTAPSSVGILGFIRNYDDYQIKISYSDKGGFYRVGKAYLWSTLPSGTRRIYSKFHDHYRCYLPNKIYKEYMKLRNKATAEALANLKREVKDKNES